MEWNQKVMEKKCRTRKELHLAEDAQIEEWRNLLLYNPKYAHWSYEYKTFKWATILQDLYLEGSISLRMCYSPLDKNHKRPSWLGE